MVVVNPIKEALQRLPWWQHLTAEQRARCYRTCAKLVSMGFGAQAYKDELHYWGKQARFNQWLKDVAKA